MAKLPKSIIRKYGISKKAWAVFRGKRSTPHHSPRRKRIISVGGWSNRRYYGHKANIMRRTHKRGGIRRIGRTVNELAVVATAFIEPYIDSVVSSFSAVAGGLTNIVKLVAAYFLKRKGGLVGGIAQTIYVIELYKLAKMMVGGGLSGIFSGAGQALTAYVN